MRTQILFIVILLALISTQVHAQGLSLGPQIGYQKSKDADDGKILVGAALRMKLGEILGAEGSVGYREESYSSGAMTVKSWPVMATGLIYPFPALYGAIGAGWYNSTIDYDQGRFPIGTVASETKQRVGWHFGGGLEIPASQSLMLTADIRYVFLDYNFTAVPGSSGVNSDFYVATVGFLFGL